MKKNKKIKDIDVTVKLSGDTLRHLMVERGNREKAIGKITSITELVREAIAFWYREGCGK